MAKKTGRKPLVPLAITLAFTVLIGVVIWYTLFKTGAPQYQQAAEMPGMGRHLVNLWITPRKDGTGLADLVGQVTNSSGMAVEVASMTFQARTPTGETSPVQGTYSARWADRTHVFSAAVQNPAAGTDLLVRFAMAGMSGEALFSLGYSR